MNQHLEQLDPTQDIDRLLDRLADGELELAAQRQLFSKLDNLPQGWKRCSLAFLESRSWSRGIGGVVNAAQAPTTPRPIEASDQVARSAAKPRRPSRDEFSFSWFSLSATILLALAIGWSSQQWYRAWSMKNSVPATSQVADARNKQVPMQLTAGEIEELRQAKQLVQRMQLTPEMVEQLKQRGNVVKWQPRGFIPYKSEDGQQRFVPWGDVQIVPVKTY